MFKVKKVVCIGIVLLTFQVSAQKKVYKEVAFNSQKIRVELHNVDHLKLVTTQEQKVAVSLSDYVENPINLIIKKSRDYINITSELLEAIQQKESDKFCAEQPFFPTYTISIPKNANVEIYYNNGNFTTENFKGTLRLKINEGSINVINPKGRIAIELFSGNVNAVLRNTAFDVTSNHGKIEIFNNTYKEQPKNKTFKGVFGKPSYRLKVNTIHANISIRPRKTQ